MGCNGGGGPPVASPALPRPAPTSPEEDACRKTPETLAWDATDHVVLVCPGRRLALRLSADGRSVAQRLRTPGDLGNLGARFLVEAAGTAEGDPRVYSIDTFARIDPSPVAASPRADASADGSVEILSFVTGRERVFRLFDARSGDRLGELRLAEVSEPWSIDYRAAGQVLTLNEHGVEAPSATRFFRRTNGAFVEVRTGGEGGVAASSFFITRSGTVRAGRLSGPWSLERLDADGHRTRGRALGCEPGRLFLSPDERRVVFGCGGTVRVVATDTLLEERSCGAVPPRTSEGSPSNLDGVFASATQFAPEGDGEAARQRIDVTTCARAASVATPPRPRAACSGVVTMAPSGTRALCQEMTSARVTSADGSVLYTLY